MTFREAVNSIMPLVESGDKTVPFVISLNPFDTKRNPNGEYEVDNLNLTPEETAGFISEVHKYDPYAMKYVGADFGGGSMPYVHDKIFCDRMRMEYYEYSWGDDNDKARFSALINFVEDNAAVFKPETFDYLSELQWPFVELDKLCPFNLATGHEGWTFNEDLAPDAIDHIERQIEDIIWRDGKAVPSKQTQGGTKAAHAPSAGTETEGGPIYDADSQTMTICGYKFEETQSVKIGKITICLAENLDAPSPYILYNVVDGGDYHHAAYTGYVQALGEFLVRQNELYGVIQAEREKRGDYWLETAVLTAEHCLPDAEYADLRGKTVIVKPTELLPENRYADVQLVQCKGGAGSYRGSMGALYGAQLFSGEKVTYDRSQIQGVADETKLPQWAQKKLALMEALKDPAVFEFGGYHFKPYRDFGYGEVDRQLEEDSRLTKTDESYAMRNMGKALDITFRSTDRQTVYDGFYAASGSTADIFTCLDNGKLYVPRLNHLFEYTEPTEKELRVAENKALKEYGRVISAAIKEGVESGGVPHTLEVLDSRFGRETADKLLATVALTSLKGDGRISDTRREWARSIIGDTENLKPISITSHPAHFDNLLMYAANRDKGGHEQPDTEQPAAPAEQPAPAANRKPKERREPKDTKPSFLGKLGENVERVERDKAAAKDNPDPQKGKKAEVSVDD